MPRVNFLPPFGSPPGKRIGLTYPGHGPFAVDFNRGWGDTDAGDSVLSSLDGTISRFEPAYGGVKISHANGYESWYFHLANIVVRLGEHVEQGQHLGSVGKTYPPPRILSAHLHYEQHRWGRPIQMSFSGHWYPASVKKADHLFYGPAIYPYVPSQREPSPTF